jgi:tRNA-binding EMAP/Myf-like protein
MLRGVESQGMVLAAEADGQIVLASFDTPVSPGAKVK